MTIPSAISQATKDGKLLPAAAENIATFLAAPLPAWATASIAELVNRGEWSELNDRFFRYLEFGTGGLAGPPISVVPAAAPPGPSTRRVGVLQRHGHAACACGRAQQ